MNLVLEENEEDKFFNFKENLSNLTITEVENLNDWDWNVLAEQNEYIKFKKIWMMFHSFNYFEKYEIEEDIFNNFLVVVREKYNWRRNPFHNFDHGVTGKDKTICFNFYLFFFFIYLFHSYSILNYFIFFLNIAKRMH